MSAQSPGSAPAPPALTSLPRLEDLPRRGEGYDPDGVRQAFDTFRRHAAQLQAQLRVLQAAGRGAMVEPSGHAVRMDALHLIRAAAEFADTLERDAQTASASQLARTEQEVRGRQNELQRQEGEIERYRNETEKQRAEILNTARNEARELLANANREATQELREAEARGARLLEQSRHQATELTNSARAEVEQTLEWARAQATAILSRAQHGAEQLLAAAGLGEETLAEVSEAIRKAAETETEAARPSGVQVREVDAAASGKAKPGPESAESSRAQVEEQAPDEGAGTGEEPSDEPQS